MQNQTAELQLVDVNFPRTGRIGKRLQQLNIIEIFSSIQGETHRAGLPTAFIRLAACNLRCAWCDTAYSFGRGTPFLLNDILTQVDQYGCRHVCVTGGEPLLQENVYPLMQSLCDRGYHVNLETGGSLSTEKVDPRVEIVYDVKCPGSKMEHKNYWENLNRLRDHDEVKFVLLNRTDYLYAVDVCQRYQLFQRPLAPLFSPVHGQLDPKELIAWFLADKIPVRLNLQLHKYIWSAEARGV